MTKAEIQFVRSLADKRTRDQEQLFVAEGSKLVEEIIASGVAIHRIYTTRCDLKGANVELINSSEMERISQLKTATDTLAVVKQPRHILSIKALRSRLTIALDGVQNPGNMGTIIRLADWFGVEDIICTKECADLYNPKVVQATMGAILRMRVHYVDNLATLLREAHTAGLNIYGTLLNGNNIYNTELILAMFTIFREQLISIAGGTNTVYFAFVVLAGVNFIVELAVNVVLAPVIVGIMNAVRVRR